MTHLEAGRTAVNGDAPAPPGVRPAEASYGAGVYEAVLSVLSGG